tara:strand:+ start:405 stop:698 length:294 start_codon:yes stop_codon:yes gene_type:complete
VQKIHSVIWATPTAEIKPSVAKNTWCSKKQLVQLSRLSVKIAPLEKKSKDQNRSREKIAEGSELNAQSRGFLEMKIDLIRSKKSPGSNHTASFFGEK